MCLSIYPRGGEGGGVGGGVEEIAYVEVLLFEVLLFKKEEDEFRWVRLVSVS